MTQPRRDIPASSRQVDRVREAMRYHDEQLEQDVEETQGDSATDEPLEPGESGEREQSEESGEP